MNEHGERRKSCRYPDCPARDSEETIAGKDYVDSLEARLIKLENHHDSDMNLAFSKIDSVDNKFDKKFTWIIGIGVTQLALFAVSIIVNHLNK